LENFKVRVLFAAIFLGLFFHLQFELGLRNVRRERKDVSEDLQMKGLFGNFRVLEKNVGS
jgi:hypothetical protein